MMGAAERAFSSSLSQHLKHELAEIDMYIHFQMINGTNFLFDFKDAGKNNLSRNFITCQ